MRNDDEKAVREATMQFYAALNAMLSGDPDPFQEVYSHADDVTCMGANGGFQIGCDQVFADWKAQADKSMGGKAEASDIQITVAQDIAIEQNKTKGNIKHPDGTLEETFLRESSVFRKEDGKWKMIAHHADALPFWVNVFSKAK